MDLEEATRPLVLDTLAVKHLSKAMLVQIVFVRAMTPEKAVISTWL